MDMTEMQQPQTVTDIQQEIGTMHGQRGIVFMFETTAGSCKVALDFYGNGANLNGKRYCDAEATALRALVASGREMTSLRHRLIY
jgi:hypothetical protein